MNIKELPEYQYRGARAMIILHDKHMRKFVKTWEKFDRKGYKLPVVEDADYASNLHLLRHVLRAARGYMTWTCEQLNLPDPEIPKTPEVDTLADEYRDYMEILLEKYIHPLKDVTEEMCFKESYVSRWKKEYCIDSMLEHAVMHPIRHRFQLKGIMKERD